LSRKRQDVAVGCREDATAARTRDVVVTCRGETTTGCRGCRGGGCIGLEAPPLAAEDAKDARVEVWRTRWAKGDRKKTEEEDSGPECFTMRVEN